MLIFHLGVHSFVVGLSCCAHLVCRTFCGVFQCAVDTNLRAPLWHQGSIPLRAPEKNKKQIVGNIAKHIFCCEGV